LAFIDNLRRGVAALTAALMLMFAGPALAQMPNQVALTPQIVAAVIASYPDVKQTADQLEAQYGEPGGGSDPGSAFGAWLMVSGAHAALNGAVQAHGFADYQSWMGALTSVFFAYTFAGEGGNANAQMAEAIAGIQNNPNLTDAQKEMMLQQMQASMGAMAMMQPSQENIDAVAPYAAEIEAMLENN
jgi:hypothetical protein